MMHRHFPILSVPFPEKEIFVRLGGNLHRTALTGRDASAFGRMAQAAFAHCHPRGVYAVFSVPEVRETGIVLETGDRLASRDFAALCKGCIAVWCAAATVGGEITAFRDGRGNVSEQAVCDAVGSETADAAMDVLHQTARRELLRAGLAVGERRFSAGYGDMDLQTQRLVDKLLGLSRIGIRLTEDCFMLPEKSVTAWAPVHRIASG